MYEAFFGLKEQPFSLSPDPRFIFLTRQHQEALAKCQYAIAQKMGVSTIYGDIGAGKTRMLEELAQSRLGDTRIHWIQTDSGSDRIGIEWNAIS